MLIPDHTPSPILYNCSLSQCVLRFVAMALETTISRELGIKTYVMVLRSGFSGWVPWATKDRGMPIEV